MAKKDKKKSTKVKLKKKIWCKVVSPKVFGAKEIGESYLQSPEKAVGRKLKSNLKELTGNVKDQNAQIGMQISKVEGSLLRTEVISYQLTPAYVKRMVRKNIGRIDDYYQLKTKDGETVTVKPLIISLSKTQRSVKTSLRKALNKILKEEIEKSDLSTFVSKLVSRRIQSDAKRALKKIYPLREVAVRALVLKGSAVGKTTVKVEDKTEDKAEEVKEELQPEIKEEQKPVEEAPTEEAPKTEESPAVEEKEEKPLEEPASVEEKKE